jgi:hypothetical protein
VAEEGAEEAEEPQAAEAHSAAVLLEALAAPPAIPPVRRRHPSGHQADADLPAGYPRWIPTRPVRVPASLLSDLCMPSS